MNNQHFASTLYSFAKENVMHTLLHNQVICTKSILTLNKPLQIDCFLDGTKITCELKKKHKQYIIHQPRQQIQLISINQYFRLQPEKTTPCRQTQKKTQSAIARVNHYINNFGFLAGCSRISHIALHDAYCKFAYPSKKKLARLEQNEGITFRVININTAEERVELCCVDTGAIYDYFLNTEAQFYPPQVAENYYATSYFAANCALLATLELQLTQAEKQDFIRAGKQALDFCEQNYTYPYAQLVFEHTDFKFSPNMEAAQILCKRKTTVPYLESNYHPVNVFALRAFNCILARKYNSAKKYLNYVQKNQTADGLIQDNYFPYYQNSKDLTYHQYATACLAKGCAYLSEQISIQQRINKNIPHLLKRSAIEQQTANELEKKNQDKKDKQIKDLYVLLHQMHVMLIRAIEFSHATLCQNGEVSYYGRGANNIYHIASAIYAFVIGAQRTGKKQYLQSAQLIYSYLSRFDPKWLPTALNSHAKTLMGWNHCEMPYNMQTSYFLLNAVLCLMEKSNQLQTTKENASKQTEIEQKKSQIHFKISENDEKSQNACSKYLQDSSIFHFTNQTYECVILNGAEQYFWANGKNTTGVSGIANLLHEKRTLSLSLNMSDATTPITDMPRIKKNGIFVTPVIFDMNCGEDQFNGEQLPCITLSHKSEAYNVKKTYFFDSEEIHFQIEIVLHQPEYSVEGLVNIALIGKEKDTCQIKIEDFHSLIEPVEKNEHVDSNPKGTGILRTWGLIKAGKALKSPLRVNGSYVFKKGRAMKKSYGNFDVTK